MVVDHRAVARDGGGVSVAWLVSCRNYDLDECGWWGVPFGGTWTSPILERCGGLRKRCCAEIVEEIWASCRWRQSRRGHLQPKARKYFLEDEMYTEAYAVDIIVCGGCLCTEKGITDDAVCSCGERDPPPHTVNTDANVWQPARLDLLLNHMT